MTITRKMIYEGTPLTAEQIKELEALDSRPVVTDEECLELTPEQLKQMALLAKKQRAERRRPVITLRVSPATLEKAKATGKGYTGFMSRLLDLAINNPEMVKRCL